MQVKRSSRPMGVALALLAGLWLAGCQTVPGPSQASESAAIQSQVVPVPVPVLGTDAKNRSIIAYFGAPDSDSEGQLFQTVQLGGFYRVYLGTDEAGQHLVQDFYQASASPQTDVFPVDPAANLLEWTVLPQQGDISFYRPTGELRGTTSYRNGLLHGRDVYYSDDGSERSVYTWNNDLLDGPFFAREPGTQRRVEGEARADEVVRISGTDAQGQALTEAEALELLGHSFTSWYQDIFR